MIPHDDLPGAAERELMSHLRAWYIKPVAADGAVDAIMERVRAAPTRHLPAPRVVSARRWWWITGAAAVAAIMVLTTRATRTPRPFQAPSVAVRLSVNIARAGVDEVRVAGDFSDWKPVRALDRAHGTNQWTGLLNLRPGMHRYVLLVDGVWQANPGELVVSDEFGEKNVLVVASPP